MIFQTDSTKEIWSEFGTYDWFQNNKKWLMRVTFIFSLGFIAIQAYGYFSGQTFISSNISTMADDQNPAFTLTPFIHMLSVVYLVPAISFLFADFQRSSTKSLKLACCLIYPIDTHRVYTLSKTDMSVSEVFKHRRYSKKNA